MLVNEPHKLPRRAIASVISRLAKHQLPGNNWPELLQCMSTCASHQSEHLREVSVLLVYQQYETIGKALQEHLDSFAALFESGLKDTSMAVRLMSLKPAERLLIAWQLTHVIKFQKLIPMMLSVIEECVNSGSDDVAVQALRFSRYGSEPMPYIETIYRNDHCFYLANQLELNAELLPGMSR